MSRLGGKVRSAGRSAGGALQRGARQAGRLAKKGAIQTGRAAKKAGAGARNLARKGTRVASKLLQGARKLNVSGRVRALGKKPGKSLASLKKKALAQAAKVKPSKL
ncbi:MAG: hypothetical protein AAF488_11315, partial [Planctomycetota bacterium]